MKKLLLICFLVHVCMLQTSEKSVTTKESTVHVTLENFGKALHRYRDTVKLSGTNFKRKDDLERTAGCLRLVLDHSDMPVEYKKLCQESFDNLVDTADLIDSMAVANSFSDLGNNDNHTQYNSDSDSN